MLKERYDIDARDARSKSWDEFKDVKFDLVITICELNAKKSPAPFFRATRSRPILAPPDPADFQGTEEESKWQFVRVASQISRRMDLLCALPDLELAPAQVRAIGEEFKLQAEAHKARQA